MGEGEEQDQGVIVEVEGKVKGEENPADLFTKHLPSKDKVHQLVRLFGCEYRDGRASAAPLLRPMEQLDSVNVVDDASVLPHLKPHDTIEQLYPRMVAPDDLGDSDFVSQAELWVVQE